MRPCRSGVWLLLGCMTARAWLHGTSDGPYGTGGIEYGKGTIVVVGGAAAVAAAAAGEEAAMSVRCAGGCSDGRIKTPSSYDLM